jgi:hypothetical protein
MAQFRPGVSTCRAVASTGERFMSLMWFDLMPYTELPDDFRDANPSVW